MERNDESNDTMDREAEARGVKPASRRLKSSITGVAPSFRSMDTRPPTFMAPAPTGFPYASPSAPKPDVHARLDYDLDDGPTKSAKLAVMNVKPFPVAREYVSKQAYHVEKDSALVQKSASKPKESEPALTASTGSRRTRWEKPRLNKVPKYFPLERTNRHIRLDDCSLAELLLKLVERLIEGFRIMSIQAKFFDQPASAALLTPENVEIYLALWESDDSKAVIVEVQRRRGDSILFHQYASHIMDAASGNFDDALFTNVVEGNLLYLKSTEQMLRTELSRVAPEHDMDKESVMALEIVTDLLKKDRRDARQLGMEGVCILADARKTVLSAAILTSRAILLRDQSSSTLFRILLGIIQNKSIEGQDEEMGGDYYEDSDDEQFFLDEDDAIQDYSPEYKEEITLLFYLALDALSHALEVVINFGIDPAGTSAVSPDSTAEVIDSFLIYAGQISNTELLVTLLQTLQRAYLKPHNAWLAAKCLRYICAASRSAKERTTAMRGMQCVDTALDVGIESHAKLESECVMLKSVLSC